MDKRKEEIAKIIFALLGAGFEVRLARNLIEIKEVFKSKSRDKWDVQQVSFSFGSHGYFDEKGNVLNITLNRLKEEAKLLLENKEFPLSSREE